LGKNGLPNLVWKEKLGLFWSHYFGVKMICQIWFLSQLVRLGMTTYPAETKLRAGGHNERNNQNFFKHGVRVVRNRHRKERINKSADMHAGQLGQLACQD
jgi:hypothetical protein